MIDELVQTFRAAGLDLDAREIAEALWLAPFLGAAPDSAAAIQVQADIQAKTAEEGPARKPASSEKREELQESRVEAGISQVGGAPVKSGRMVPFRSPTAPALPHTLPMGRALRPLNRRVDSPHRWELDEEATVERIAQTGLWEPVLRASRTRWLKVALVVDASRSMTIWRRTISEFRAFLRHHGAFRDVRVWSLSTEGNAVWLYRGMKGAEKNAPRRHPHELLDASGRQLVLVVTDCVAPAWHTGAEGQLFKVFHDWGRHLPVSILQLLPQRVWLRTALRRYPALWVHGPGPGVPNTRLVYGPSVGVHGAGFQGGAQPALHKVLPVPVVELEKNSLAAWAEVIAGAPGGWSPGILLRQPAPDRRSVSRQGPPDAHVLLRHFDATASPQARRLARLLAAAPLTLDVMHLVRQTLLPEAEHIHLAEIFLSGLLVEVRSEASAENEVQYDFAPGVRTLLQQSSPFPDSFQVLRCVSEMIERKLGRTLDFSAMLMDPTSGDSELVGKAHWPFAQVAAGLLTQLGGDYKRLAERLMGAAPANPESEKQEASAQKRSTSKASAKKADLHGSGVSLVAPSDRPEGIETNWPEESGVRLAHAQGIRGGGVMLGVLATGVDADHPEHVGRHIDFRYVSLFPNSPHSPAQDMRGFDPDGFGTHVCGIAAGKFHGVAPEADLFVASVIESETIRISLGRVAAGIEWMLHCFSRPENATRPAVVLMPLGFPLEAPQGMSATEYRNILRSLQTLTRRLLDSNILPVVAAGNGGPNTVSYPAAFPECLTVGAVDNDRRVASYSASAVINKRVVPDVMGYGVNVYSSTMRRSDSRALYERMSGTSMAAAYVAGIATLYRCRAPDLTATEVRDVILANTLRVRRSRNHRAGVGLAVFR
ncbi:SAV_2336 N-terminal domain-related protein [Hyalangium versicolor]|uniref:SAV_2336 N-terminal domain-related protein n=1 Tax=Hyalangium versicolor TaxID=2861190 RepID=UPI001CCE2B72|nr:SAV_2336 N-terminal domain-related protein [Hyalangium versicolor]